MDIRPQYILDIYPHPNVEVLGKPLWPLTYGHVMLMYEHKCMFVYDINQVDWADLILGVTICSMEHEDFVKGITENTIEVPDKDGNLVERKFTEYLQEWGDEQKVRKDINIFHELAKFIGYLTMGCKMTETWESKEGGGSSEGAKPLEAIATMCLTKLGWTETKLYNTPLTKIYRRCIAWTEQESGKSILVSDRMLEIQGKK